MLDGVVVVVVSICAASKRLLKFRNALAERMTVFGFVIETAAEDFDLVLDVVEPAIRLGKMLGDRCEFARAVCWQGSQ